MSSLMAVEGLQRTRAVAGDVPSLRPADALRMSFSVASRWSSFLSHAQAPTLSCWFIFSQWVFLYMSGGRSKIFIEVFTPHSYRPTETQQKSPTWNT